MSARTDPRPKRARHAASGKSNPGPAATPTDQDSSASWATSPAIRRSMQANRRRDTGPELAIKRLLHARGLRYRVDARPLPTLRRTADVIFTRARIAVFIDGCWWHGCSDHYRPPALNAAYWAVKVARNRERDHQVDEALLAAGWRVIRIWEVHTRH